MDLERACRPFDRTYEGVTRRIRAFGAGLPQPQAGWLERLVEAFAKERATWGVRPELANYRLRLTLLRTRLLRLVGGAYLHISYDLPRAMADEWPGGARCPRGPSEQEGQQIYFQLSDVFPAALIDSARDFRTVGLAAIFQRGTAQDVLAPAALWVDHQRQGAWLNGQFLARCPNRAAAEAKMAEAMTAAFDDASLWRPWSLAHLVPPTSILRTPWWVSWATLMVLVDELKTLLAIALPTAFVSWQLAYERYQLEGLGGFVEVWGLLTADYVAYAAREPEGFDTYRVRRREELGIAPRGAAAAG